MGAPCNKNIVNTMVFESFHIFTDLLFFVDLWLLWRVIWSVFGDLGGLYYVLFRIVESINILPWILKATGKKKNITEGWAGGGSLRENLKSIIRI